MKKEWGFPTSTSLQQSHCKSEKKNRVLGSKFLSPPIPCQDGAILNDDFCANCDITVEGDGCWKWTAVCCPEMFSEETRIPFLKTLIRESENIVGRPILNGLDYGWLSFFKFDWGDAWSSHGGDRGMGWVESGKSWGCESIGTIRVAVGCVLAWQCVVATRGTKCAWVSRGKIFATVPLRLNRSTITGCVMGRVQAMGCQSTIDEWGCRWQWGGCSPWNWGSKA